MVSTLTNKLLKFLLPVLIIPTLITIVFFYVYLTNMIKNDIVDMSKNMIMNEIARLSNENGSFQKNITKEKNNLPSIIIMNKDFIDSEYKDIFESYFQETDHEKNKSLYHDEKNNVMIKPLQNKDNEIDAFIVCEYKNILSKKTTLTKQTFLFVSTVIILITFISIVLTIIFSHNIINPIRLLIKGTKRLSDGDITHKINISSDDEVGVLVHSFNNMLDKLRLSSLVFENSNDAIMITDSSAVILDINTSFSQMTGYSKEEAIGKKASLLKSGRHDEQFYHELWNSLLTNGSWRGNVWNRKKDGSIYPELINISSLADENGEINNFISIATDITALKENEEHLEFLAHHDTLTSLPNRLYLNIRLEHSIDMCKRLGSYMGVCFLDLDDFKIINDMHGHDMGDKVLKEAAKRLQLVVRNDDTLARFGGDEFVLVFENIKAWEEMTKIAQHIVSSIKKPFEIDEHTFQIGSSIGISIYPDDGENVSSLLQKADVAMYEAKTSGKNTFRYYEQPIAKDLSTTSDAV